MNQIVNAVVAACENVMTSSTASNNTAGPPLIPALSIVGLAVPVAVAFPPLPALPSFVQVDTGLPLLTASVAALNQINGDNASGVHELPPAPVRSRLDCKGFGGPKRMGKSK